MLAVCSTGCREGLVHPGCTGFSACTGVYIVHLYTHTLRKITGSHCKISDI